MDSGYWKVLAEEEAHKRLAFFTPDRNRKWKVMPMGSLNAASTFLSMTMNLKMEWDTPAKELGLKMLHQK